MSEARPLCVNCGKWKALPEGYRRGLCWGCYGKLAVRLLFPKSDSPKRLRYGRRGEGNGTPGVVLAAEATAAAPGSVEKMKVMAARVRAGFAAFHPLDVGECVAELCRPFEGLPSWSISGVTGLEDDP